VRIIGICLVAVVLAISTRSAAAADFYYMIVFSAQSDPNLPRSSHTWATFVKATGQGSSGDYSIESHTISWCPASLVIVPLRLRPEPGRNLDLKTTLQWAERMGDRVTAWGPYRIKKGLYARALQQIRLLDRGGIAYKAIDERYRGRGVSNCIHAVSDIDTDPGWLATGTAFGNAASYLVARHLERWVVDPRKTYPRVIEKLGLETAAINYRTLESRSVAISPRPAPASSVSTRVPALRP
jgi:hypothetical protein